MEDMIELGLEAFDHITDRYHDTIYDHVVKVGPWVKDQRARSAGPFAVVRSKSNKQKTVPVVADPTMSGAVAGYDDGRGRRSDRPPPAIRVDGPRDERDHIYPPAPQPMVPPYPTPGPGQGNSQLIAMPPDAPYPLQRRTSSGNYRPVRRDNGFYSSDEEDFDDRGRRRRHSRGLRRTRSERGPRSQSRHRHHRSDYQDRDRRSESRYEERKGIEKAHLTATITGALAGGLIGKEVGKGDLMATLAGAVVGGLGANVAEREWEKRQRREEKTEQKWENKWGYRS